MVLTVAAAGMALAPEWVRAQSSGEEIFRATQAPNLPTTRTIPRGQLLFEISHRFDPPISGGADVLWGLDGPVRNRLGLAYAPSDRILLGLLRSNFQDNLEVDLKARLFDGAFGTVPVSVGVMVGAAWNTEVVALQGARDNEGQQYAQLIVDMGLHDRLALGVVPTLLRNPRILDSETPSSLSVGLHGALEATELLALVGEWIVSEARPGQEHDARSVGVELATRGHVFKLLVTNQPLMNPTQHLGGTPYGAGRDDWRLGFNVQRRLGL